MAVPTTRQPPFIFRIDEICAGVENPPNHDGHGNWGPSTYRTSSQNAHPGIGSSGQYWLCDGQSIVRLAQPPAGAQLYKTFSVYYVGGVGYWVLEGDARAPTPGTNFQRLTFDCYDQASGTSYLTNAGQLATLRLQPLNPRWANMLLPRTYHSPVIAQSNGQGPGGLIGDLPIFIALMALTTSPQELPGVIPWMFRGGSWQPTHNWIRVTDSGRGVVVAVYTCPPGQCQLWPAGSTARNLYDIEIGNYGEYFV